MTHVFIVNKKTFKVHLEYMFAGTGAAKDAPFLLDATYRNPQKKEIGVTASAERNLVAMIADVSRIRVGDKILFYLQSSSTNPGMFFGVFEAASCAFYQPNDDNYLTEELGKSLNFRVLIKAFKVYPKGISEHEALDNLTAIQRPYDMCWSLIYRKLKGNRGCTMITDKEAERLFFLLSLKNDDQYIVSNAYTYANGVIEVSDSSVFYQGKKNSLDLLPRLLYKLGKNSKCESHLQAFIVQNIDRGILSRLILEDIDNLWIGNEVSCGVGMQRIDVSTMQYDDNYVYINIIELKCVEAYNEIVDSQIPWYITWIREYIVPTFNKKVIITPVIISKPFENTQDLTTFEKYCSKLYLYDNQCFKLNPVKLITYTTAQQSIGFKKEF